MRAVPIDDYLEAFEEGRTPEAPPLERHTGDHWGRIVEEARRARIAADGGRWKIGQLASQVEKRYGSSSIQRFAEEIGESYSTVRRYRWVAESYDSNVRFKYPSLSFSHFQAVARLHDRDAWLMRAERGGWSVDRLAKAAHDGPQARTPDECAQLDACIDSMRRQLNTLSSIEAASLTPAARARAAQALVELALQIKTLQRRLVAGSRAPHKPSRKR
ncbi:MAG: hypothetical protein ACYDCC_06535 [Actinomycetota bacterium]